MFRNFIKIAIRNITRNKAYSAINILGLTLGITCSSLLFLLVIDELGYDKFHENADNIYRVVEIDNTGDEIRYYGQTTPPVGPTMVEDYEEVKNYARLFQFGGHINFEKEGTKYAERNYYFTDSKLFEVFDFEWVIGDPSTALSEPNTTVIDEDWAVRLFGSPEKAIGQEIDAGERMGVNNVTGVIKTVPQNSHLQFKILVSLPTSMDFFPEYVNNWSTYGAYTYVQLDEQANFESLEEKVPDFIASHFDPEDNRNFYLQPLTDIHFNSKEIEFGTDHSKGEKAYIYIFIAVGGFMLLIACINYMNLATAKSLHRGKEIGMRKVSGALRHQLIFQFLSESVVMSLLSLALSVGLVDLLLPYFNHLTDKQFLFNTETFGGIFSLLFLITIVVGLISGLYPAFLMSKLKPANILKGSMSTGRGSVMFRKVLVITQFTLSIVMIIATIVASNQLDFIQNQSLGFDKDQLIIVDINSRQTRVRAETMVTEFQNSPYIEKVGVSSRVPGEWKNLAQVYVKGENSNDSLRSNYMGFDERMLDVYNIELAAGENFSGQRATDSLQVLVNESLLRSLDIEEPIGKLVSIGGGDYKIAGVLKNFNFQSLHNEIAPLVVGYQYNAFQQIDYFSLKFDPDHAQEAVAHASSVHDQFDASTPIEYHFLDDQWALFYTNDRRASNVFAVGASITIFIACLGLFGLASFIIQKRTKEIGVRKVLGASLGDLFLLLSKTFVYQVCIAFLIATPLAWYFMNDWLDSFAYRFSLGVTEFLIAGVVALVIALASVSYRVFKAARVNPANTLKDE